MTEDEAREAMAKLKSDNPDVDWSTHSTYALVNQETGVVDRVGFARNDKIMSFNEIPTVGL